MIKWDIDGTIRNLHGEIFGYGGEPDTWETKTDDGKSVFQVVKDHPMVLVNARSYREYLRILNEQDVVFILSAQPKSWQMFTDIWLENHITTEFYVQYTDGSPKGKLKYLNEEDILIDDYPYFSDNRQICMVTRKYNKNLNVNRVRNGDELREVIENALHT